MANDAEILGKCPLCDGSVIEKKTSFGCSNAEWKNTGTEAAPKWENSGCGYSIYKLGMIKIGGREVTKEDVKTLLSQGHFTMSITRETKIIPDKQYGLKMDFSK